MGVVMVIVVIIIIVVVIIKLCPKKNDLVVLAEHNLINLEKQPPADQGNKFKF